LQDLPGAVPDLIHPPTGCRFAPRCSLATPACTQALPAPVRLGPQHSVFCRAVTEVA
jgi:oligopeptide/dipeptide ABC transporter ATP-binding protein